LKRDKYGANDIRPGLAGWAQINGRGEFTIEIIAKLDGEYVQSLSYGLDLKCFFGTIVKVLRREGVIECDAVKEVAVMKEPINK